MSLVKKLFAKIDRDDIDENKTELVSSGEIDSLDIMELVSLIEKHFKAPLDAKYIEAKHFESMSALENMLKVAYNATF